MPESPIETETTATPPRWWQFSLTSAFLTITLVAVCLGMFRLGAVVGTLFSLLTVPAFMRTAIVLAIATYRGRRQSVPIQLTEFMFSLIVMIPVLFLGWVAVLIALAVAWRMAELNLVPVEVLQIVVPGCGIVVSFFAWCASFCAGPANE